MAEVQSYESFNNYSNTIFPEYGYGGNGPHTSNDEGITHKKIESEDANFVGSSSFISSGGKSAEGSMEPKDVTQLTKHMIKVLKEKFLADNVEGIMQILREQETHDLWCPNCSSCITKSIIVERKQTIPVPQKPFTDPHLVEPLLTPAENVEVCGCLSCFTVFFRAVNIFGKPTPDKGSNDENGGCNCLPFSFGLAPTAVTVPGEDSIITVGPGTSTNSPELTHGSSTSAIVPDPPLTPVNVLEGLDILKSIVYGGLPVSISSLGVISSAAGSDMKALSVIVMALSTLVAGLLMVTNNMLDLAHHHKEEFRKHIGHSFWFNGLVALISYLIFGSLAPAVYSVSFRGNNEILYKFMVTSAVSLVSIVMLSVTKAKLTGKSSIRLVLYYTTSGFWASFAGFFAGEYIQKLLKYWGIYV